MPLEGVGAVLLLRPDEVCRRKVRQDAGVFRGAQARFFQARDGVVVLREQQLRDTEVREGLGSWMRAIVDDVRAHAGRKRAIAVVAALGVNSIGVAVMLAVFIHTAGLTGTEVGIAAGTALLNQKLLEAIFGEGAMAELIGNARAGLASLMAAAFENDRKRFDALVPPPAALRDVAAGLRDAVDGLQA